MPEPYPHPVPMHHSTHLDRRTELSLFDPDSQRSLAQLLPEAMVHQLRNLFNGNDSHLTALTERALKNELSRKGKPIGSLDVQLKAQFWFEYNRVQDENEKAHGLNMSRVVGKAISKEAFYKHYITDPGRLAYLICPPPKYEDLISLALNTSVEKLIELMEGLDDKNAIAKLTKVMETLHGKAMQMKYRGGRGQKTLEPEVAVEQGPELTVAERIAKMKAERELSKGGEE